MDKNYMNEKEQNSIAGENSANAIGPHKFLKYLKETNTKEILALATFMGSTASVLLLFGFNQSGDFPIFDYMSISDYINISIRYFTPMLVIIFIALLLFPFSKLFMAITPIRENKGFSDNFVLPAKLVFLFLIITVLMPDVHNVIKINSLFVSWDSLFVRSFVVFLLSMFLQFKGVKRLTSLFNLKEFKHKIVLSVIACIPTYAISLIFMGFVTGDVIYNSSLPRTKWELTYKDNQIIHGALIFTLEKYVILKNDSSDIVAIRTDNLKSITKLNDRKR